MIAVHAAKVVPFTGSLSVLVVVEDTLADDEVKLDDEADPEVGVPWIPSCEHPATSAVETAATAIDFIFISSSLLTCQLVMGGG
ncbi:hypothetical protein BKG75_22670 [Mycobacteroides chelonae]|nr:hypothetical protein BKG75_22670 [Mycobacteroides chelonae]